MGMMDKMKGMFGQAKDVAADKSDQVKGGVDKAGDMVDEKTGGKHAQHVDKAQDFANDQVDKLKGDKDSDSDADDGSS